MKDSSDLRLILPFGLSLELGDVVSVGKDGNLTLEGKASSILGIRPKADGPPGEPFDFATTSDAGVGVSFRAAGTASSISDLVPDANAGFDLSFGKAESWLLAIRGRKIQALAANPLRKPILDAYKRNVWRPDWAIISSIATVESMTLIASTSANAKVALVMGADVASSAPLEAKLTADISIAFSTQQLTQCVVKKKTVAFCKALRVRDPWWKSPDVVVLHSARKGAKRKPAQPDDEEFWEEVGLAPAE